MTNRRTALTTAVLALGLAALVTACGPDDPDPAPAAASPAPTTAAAATPTPAPTASAAPATPAPTASQAGKPCHQDPARPEFAKLNSAATAGGVTKVNVTPVSCSYHEPNDENVEYTPTGDATSYALAKNAVVQVVEFSGKGTKERTITPAELATYKLASTPYFTIHRDAQGKVTAMSEIYHP